MHAFLLRSDTLLRKLNCAPAIALNPLQHGFGLRQLSTGGLQASLCIHNITGGGSFRRLLRVLRLRNFVTKAGNGCSGGTFLRLQLRGVENGNQVSRFDLSTFVNQQLLDATLDLRTDNHLVGVDGADQNEVTGMVHRKPVIAERDRGDDGEQDEDFVARAHWRPPALSTLRNNAAETKSSTAARRSANRSEDSGSTPDTAFITGALAK